MSIFYIIGVVVVIASYLGVHISTVGQFQERSAGANLIALHMQPISYTIANPR